MNIFGLQAQFLTPGSAFPPPFHLIYLLALNVFHCKRHGCRRGGLGETKMEGVTQTLKKKQTYFLLLKRLLQLKHYRDSHKTEVDKLADLRMDLYEKLTEKVEKMRKGVKKDN